VLIHLAYRSFRTYVLNDSAILAMLHCCTAVFCCVLLINDDDDDE